MSEFLELPHGIPSDDTFRRVFERLEPQALCECLTQWVQQLIPSLEKKIVPIDGKCLRGSYDREQGIKALHLVTAWAAEQSLTLGQIRGMATIREFSPHIYLKPLSRLAFIN